MLHEWIGAKEPHLSARNSRGGRVRVGPRSKKVAYEQVTEERGGMGGAFQAGDKVHTQCLTVLE